MRDGVAIATSEGASIYRSMLRIFRGERPTEQAAQPGQRNESAEMREPESAQAVPPAQAAPQQADVEPGFLPRGRMRRRSRFLRAARELAYRDLGGLVFDLHRFGQHNDEVVKAKLDTLTRIDSELRELESALRERRLVTVLREAGVTACPRCAAIHGSGDRFCPACGLAVDQAERPIAAPNVAPAGAHPGAPTPFEAPVSASTPAPSTAPTRPDSEPAPEQATEVIRSGQPRQSQRTVAFDSVSPLYPNASERQGGVPHKRT